MTEMIYTTATIGGRLRRKHAEEIADIINGSFCDLYNGGKTLEEIVEAAAASERFSISGQVNFGNPGDLRTYLQAKRLPYVITYCAGGEFTAGGYAYRHGSGEIEFEANDDGVPSLTLTTLKVRAAEGHSLQSVIRTIENCQHENVPAIVFKD